jgi:hypothetical protein
VRGRLKKKKKKKNTGEVLTPKSCPWISCFIFSLPQLGIKTSNLFLVKQMKPSSIPGDLKLNSSQAELFQGWLRNGQCPKGTIPIIRRSQEDHEYTRSIHWNQRRMQLNHSFVDSVPNHEVSFYQNIDI